MMSTLFLRRLEGSEFLLRGQLSEGHSVCVCVCVCRGVPLVTHPQYAISGSSSLQTGHVEPEGCHMPFHGWRAADAKGGGTSPCLLQCEMMERSIESVCLKGWTKDSQRQFSHKGSPSV